MNCPNCNNPYDTGQKFCSACGSPLPAQPELKCPKCQSKIEHNQKFCSVCGTDLQHTTINHATGTPVSYPNNSSMPSHDGIRCSECGKLTNSLKQATIFNKLLFLIVHTRWQTVTYTCCPECMRKHIANRSAATLITGNFLWPILVLPLHGYHLYNSYQPGHSKAIRDIIR